MLTTVQFGREEHNTILSGVLELIRNDLWPLAVIVFTASIVLPLIKLFGLTWMLVATRRGSSRMLVERTRLYRTIDTVGRWSNIDIFSVSVLVAILQFGSLTAVHAGAGLVAFAAVVIITMLATMVFDSRLMWDVRRDTRMTDSTENGEPTRGRPEEPRARVRAQPFSWVWLVPIGAVAIVIWLAWRALSDRGPAITISFRNVDGLQAGQTKIQHRNVDLGTVESLELTPDMSRVIVHARMTRRATEHLTENTRFAIIAPHVGVGGISGLSTIVSGSYIEMYPGKPGPSKRGFVGLDAAAGAASRHARPLVHSVRRRPWLADARLADLLSRRRRRRSRRLRPAPEGNKGVIGHRVRPFSLRESRAS